VSSPECPWREPDAASVENLAVDPARRRGRPREEGLRNRCLEAAIDVYAEHGWSGFNFEAVANAAQAGRPALYRRWSDRSALLIDAFLHTTPTIADEDLGSLTAELKHLLVDYSSALHGNRGRAGQRLYLDGPTIPSIVAAVHARLMGRRYAVISSAISRASERASTTPSISPRLAFGLLLGPALLWNMGDARPVPLDVDAAVKSVTKLIGITD
jgi:AcrR family transcriptional regulator